MRKNKPEKVAVFYVGGTPGMVPKDIADPTSPLVPRAWEELETELKDSLSTSLRINSVDIDYFALGKPKDSSEMAAQDWIAIAHAVKEKYNQYNGFVVIHGSDTMAYTASALSFIFSNLAKNVVLTGANYPMIQDRDETLDNITLAVRTALDEMKPSVKIAFGNVVLEGCRATKASQYAYTVFETPKLPLMHPVKIEAREKLAETEAPLAELKLNPVIVTNILVVPCTPDFNGDFYRAALSTQRPSGVILQTFEAGNVPAAQSFRSFVEALNAKEIPTIAISQTFGSHVRFGKYDASSFLIENNVMNGADMTLEAALTKMMVVLGNYPKSRIKELIESNLRGELSPS